MAVTSIHEVWKGRDSDGTLEDTRYVRILRVVTNDPTDGPDVIYAAVALTPYFFTAGATHPTNSLARLISVKPVNDIGPCQWLVTGTYSTKLDFDENPANDEVEITWDDEDFQRPVVKDRDGNAVVNSCGDPPVEPLMFEDATSVATIKANVTSLPSWFAGSKKAVNSDAITIDGVPAAAKFARVKSRSLGWWKYRGLQAYRELTLKIEVLAPTEPDFELRWLDQGFNRKPTSAEITAGDYVAGDRVPIKLNGEYPTEPVLLDGAGQRLSDPSPTTAVFNTTPYPRLVAFGGFPGVTAT